jgi:streptogramin lyase
MTRYLALLLAAGSLGAQVGRFEQLATYKGLGALVASSVGPGPAEGAERFYLSYLYINNTIDVVGVDPDTGEFQVFPNPAPTESGARSMVLGPNGRLYLGTLTGAHFLELDPKAGTLKDLGRPSLTEQYIWDVAFGPDGKLYGATYPQSKLVRYDPASGALEDLGRMDPVEQYAHYVAGGDDGFMYVGIGTSKANIAAYEISTGEHREILPAEFQTVGQARVYRGQDGNVYGVLGSRYFRLRGWLCPPISAKEASPAVPNNRLAGGRTVSVSGRTIRVTGPGGREVSERRFEYAGNDLPMFRIGFGPDDVLYGSSVLPIHFLRLDSENAVMSEIGDLGGGEIYSFLARESKLLMAGYSSLAPLMVWDPEKPFNVVAGEKNPVLVDFKGSDSGWRPQAFINGPGGRVYIGSVAGYGKLGGPLTVWDVESGAVDDYPHLVQDQSVVSLAVWNGLIVGGATTGGGGGSHPTQKEAKIFIWDPKQREKLFETVPVPGAASVNDLIAAANGLVYGFAGRTLFVFDPESRQVKLTRTAPFSSTIYNSVALGPDGKIWGLTSAGIFSIDPESNEVTLAARSPRPITAGFALRDNAIYFVCGPQLWRWVLEAASQI